MSKGAVSEGDALCEEVRAELNRTQSAVGVRGLVGSWRDAKETVALVPTMGNLHEGHLSLMRLASRYTDRVICSIFVNPTQFRIGEDYAAYPRTLGEDVTKLREQGVVDLLFCPSDEEIYPCGPEASVEIEVPGLSDELCGASRPGHFSGVASVVCRLLNIVMPDILVLGEKDYQQLVLLTRMIEDLQFPVQVISGPILREEDGLAMSSRNRYLEGEQRKLAPRLHMELEQIQDALRKGVADYHSLESEALRSLKEAGFRPEYVEIRNATDLAKPNGQVRQNELVVLAAAWLGKARLIDNIRT